MVASLSCYLFVAKQYPKSSDSDGDEDPDDSDDDDDSDVNESSQLSADD
jgi:hypothetical protein